MWRLFFFFGVYLCETDFVFGWTTSTSIQSKMATLSAVHSTWIALDAVVVSIVSIEREGENFRKNWTDQMRRPNSCSALLISMPNMCLACGGALNAANSQNRFYFFVFAFLFLLALRKCGSTRNFFSFVSFSSVRNKENSHWLKPKSKQLRTRYAKSLRRVNNNFVVFVGHSRREQRTGRRLYLELWCKFHNGAAAHATHSNALCQFTIDGDLYRVTTSARCSCSNGPTKKNENESRWRIFIT